MIWVRLRRYPGRPSRRPLRRRLLLRLPLLRLPHRLLPDLRPLPRPRRLSRRQLRPLGVSLGPRRALGLSLGDRQRRALRLRDLEADRAVARASCSPSWRSW